MYKQYVNRGDIKNTVPNNYHSHCYYYHNYDNYKTEDKRIQNVVTYYYNYRGSVLLRHRCYYYKNTTIITVNAYYLQITVTSYSVVYLRLINSLYYSNNIDN